MSKLHKLRALRNYQHFNKATTGIGIFLFAIVGTVLLFNSHAATPFASLEPEQGNVAGAACINPDIGASGSSSVKFGTVCNSGTLWYVTPSGGGDCTQAAPCGDINTAYQKANQGDTVLMAAGSYGGQTVGYRAAASGWTNNVVIRSASGTSVNFGGLNIETAHVTIKDVITPSAGIDANADYSRMENVDVRGSTFIVGPDYFYLGHSRLGPQDGNDTLRLDPAPSGLWPDHVTIEDNFMQSGHTTAADQHLDVFQTLGSTNLVFQRNFVRANGTSAAIQIGNLTANANDLFQNNVFQACGTPEPGCGTFNTVSDASGGTRYVNNTILGSIYPNQVAVYIGNIIDNPGGYMICYDNLQYNLVNTGPNSYCAGTNHVLVDATLNYAADGWHLVAGHPAINLGVVGGTPNDYDGKSRDAQPDAGADEL